MRIACLLALMVILVLGVTLHPLHTLASDQARTDHIGLLCAMVVGGDAGADHHGATDGSHGDCSHHFELTMVFPVGNHLIDRTVDRQFLSLKAHHQLALTGEPPPPRLST